MLLPACAMGSMANRTKVKKKKGAFFWILLIHPHIYMFLYFWCELLQVYKEFPIEVT
jgi:hypothetical protein